MKEATLQNLQEEAWRLTSLVVRQSGIGPSAIARCFTCNNNAHWKEMDAGHYIHASESSKYSYLYFFLKNVHPQCSYCNKHKGGNTAEYAYRLVQEYGEGILAELQEMKNDKHRLNRLELQAIIELRCRDLGIEPRKWKVTKQCAHRRKDCTICHSTKK
jgi:hypothetical protein